MQNGHDFFFGWEATGFWDAPFLADLTSPQVHLTLKCDYLGWVVLRLGNSTYGILKMRIPTGFLGIRETMWALAINHLFSTTTTWLFRIHWKPHQYPPVKSTARPKRSKKVSSRWSSNQRSPHFLGCELYRWVLAPVCAFSGIGVHMCPPFSVSMLIGQRVAPLWHFWPRINRLSILFFGETPHTYIFR